MSEMIKAVSATIPTLPAAAGRGVSGGAVSLPSPAVPAPQLATAESGRVAFEDVVARMQQHAEAAGAELQFSVLRQIPSEEVLRIAHAIAEQLNPLVQAVA
jgi:hypothetical protein